MPSLPRAWRAALACAALALLPVTVQGAGPISETCNNGEDDSHIAVIQAPSSLTPGIPGHVILRATNATQFNRTWIGNEQTQFPYRLGSWSLSGNKNQVLWSNWRCSGYNLNNDPLNQRAFISDAQSACHNITVAPGSSYDFEFDITAPPGASGNLFFAWSMVYDAGTTCQGFFGDAQYLTIQVASGPSCGNVPLDVVDNQWRLQVYQNETLTEPTVEQRYVSPVGNGGFNLNLSNGASQCAGTEHYSTRLTRNVFLQAGDYTFQVHADDGVRLKVGGVTLIDQFVAPPAVDLTARVRAPNDGVYTIEVEHSQATPGAALSLSWFREGGARPPAPTGLTANAFGNGNISLQWNAVTGATSYNIKRTTDSNPGATFTPVGTSTSATFVNSGLSDGTYYYVVTAVNGDGESDPSNRASATLSTSGGSNCTTFPLVIPDFAWLLEFYNNRDLSGAVVRTRYDAQGSGGFNFAPASMPPIDCVGAVGTENYSVRFTRKADFPRSGNYRFQFTSDDGIRVWLDGQSIVDRWQDQILTDSVLVPVTQGQHDLRVEYYQGVGSAQVALSWSFDNGNPTTPPAAPVVSATAGNAQVILAWNDVPGADVYHVKRRDPIFGFGDIATTSNTRYVDTSVVNGTTYSYEVQAENLNVGLGPDSAPVSATPQAPPQGNPSLRLEIRAPDSTLVAPGSTLNPNADGWPSPNPLEVRMLLSCPSDRTSGCIGPVDIRVASADGKLRINGASQDAVCLPHQNPGPSFHTMGWACPAIPGSIGLAAGETKTLTIGIVVQPSEQTSIDVNATWGDQHATESLNVAAAAIHPLIVIPGILGTMPPAYVRGELDPMLGVYTPIIEQLKAIGYEEDVTLFRMPYDWRNSNRITARYLRDRIREALLTKRATYVNTDQVDLLVHSMGGLITRIYVEDEALDANGQKIAYGGDIRKVIFAASPHRGFPEDYKTYEGNNWTDFLYKTPALDLGMNALLWPAFIKKHWMAAHPNEAPPGACVTQDPRSPPACVYDYYAMSHDAVGGIDSLREMLPTPEVDQLVAPFFGAYLCESYPPCTNPYPFGTPRRPVNPLLPILNFNINLLATRLGADNLYVIFGTDPSPANSTADDTDVVFDVKAPPVPPPTSLAGWANGEPERRFTAAAGDDLIPEYSTNLKRLIPSIPDTNVAGFRINNGASVYGLPGPAFRHKQIMYSHEMQAVYVPKWLAGLGPIPFSQTYVQPDVVAVLAKGLGYIISGECPVNLLITDPQGRRLGYDPAAGASFKEIPGSLYAAPNTENQFIMLGEPQAGTYHLKVSAFGDGKFLLSANQLNAAGTPRRWLAEGTVNTGDVLEYDIFIDPTLPIQEHPPVADAGPEQQVSAEPPACKAVVRLDGSRSSDPDGEPLTFDWTGPFGYATGVRPTVVLPVGSHDITLMVQDGQQKGATAHTRVTVSGPSPNVEPHVTPSLLQPADATMREVTVTVDVTGACSARATCRIVDIDSNEGDSHDWQITGALKAKLRAERDGDGDGRKYKLRIECKIEGGDPVRKTINVTVPPPGRIKGKGEIYEDGRVHKFDFDVWESRAGKDNGRVNLDVMKAESEKSAAAKSGTDKFRSTRVDSVIFYNDDDSQPGGGLKVDSVKAYGVGEWNGKPGYTFEMRATDAGEPGAGRDDLKLIVRDPQGKSVASVDEPIDSGNIESVKPPK